MPVVGAPQGYFQQTVGAYAPMVGQPYRPQYGYEGLPGAQSGGMMGMGMQMFAPMLMQQLSQTTSMMPMGLHGQNIHDTMRAQRFTQMHEELLRQATETDKRTMMDTWRGLAVMAGTDWNADTRQSARQLTDVTAKMMPMLVQAMPDLADQMMGSRGSAAVMAHRIHQGGRYRIDPVTGQMGMSSNTVRDVVNEFARQLDEGETRGLSAGQMGMLFEEMQNRGMMRADTRSIRQRTLATVAGMDVNQLDRNILGQIAKARGLERNERGAFELDMGTLRPQEIDALREDPAVQQRMRALDARRIGRQLESYSSAIKAVRDIFGDMGQPNAPMRQLVAGLEAMTGGNLSQLQPGRLEMMVRNTYNLAQQTGVSMDQAMQMQHYAAGMAGQLGIEPIFAMGATQGALAFGGAYRSQGLNAPQLAAWGRMNAAEAQQMDLNLRMQANASRQANQMNTALRIADAMGPDALSGTAAGRYVAALRAGESQFRGANGEMMSVGISETQFRSMMSDAGIDEDTVSQMLQDQFSNREFGEKYNTGGLVRRLQPHETRKKSQSFVEAEIYQRVRNRLIKEGMDPSEAEAKAKSIAKKAGARVISSLSNASPEQLTNRAARNDLMAEAMMSAFEGTSAEYFGKEFALLTAEQAYGAMDTMVREKYPGLKSAQGMFQMMNPETLRAARLQEERARFTSERQSDMADLGRGGTLRRMMDEIQRDEGTDMERVVGRVLGAIDESELREVFRKDMEHAGNLYHRIRDVEAKMQATTDPDRRAELEEERDALRAQYRTVMGQMSHEANKRGVFVDRRYGAKDVGRVTASLDRLNAYTSDIPQFANREQADKFWKSKQGSEYRRAVKSAMTNVDDMIASASASRAIKRKLGDAGVKKLEAARASRERLRELAAVHTGGDLAALLGGDFVSSEKYNVMDEVLEHRETIDALADRVEGVLDGGEATKPEKLEAPAREPQREPVRAEAKEEGWFTRMFGGRRTSTTETLVSTAGGGLLGKLFGGMLGSTSETYDRSEQNAHEQDPQGAPRSLEISGTLNLTNGQVNGQAYSAGDVPAQVS